MDPNKGSQANQLNWSKMLNEDLDDMLRKKMEKIQEEVISKKFQE
jgi:hypothetical protein